MTSLRSYRFLNHVVASALCKRFSNGIMRKGGTHMSSTLIAMGRFAARYWVANRFGRKHDLKHACVRRHLCVGGNQNPYVVRLHGVDLFNPRPVSQLTCEIPINHSSRGFLSQNTIQTIFLFLDLVVCLERRFVAFRRRRTTRG